MVTRISRIILLLLLFAVGGCTSLGVKEIPVEQLEAKYATGASAFLDVAGMRVHYRDEGEGEALLLIHGILASLHTWEGWAKELKADYRVISLDLPGFGLTGPANFAYNRDNYIEFLHAFLEKLEVERVTVVGNSLGGFFAWNYAIDHPEQVERLVLLDSAGYAQRVPFPMKLYTTPMLGEVTTKITPRSAIAANLRDVYGDPEKVTEETIDRYHELQLRPGNREASKALFKYAVTQSDSDAEGIERIKMPTMILWGGDDDWVPTELTRYWQRDVPHAQVIIYPGVGHVPMEEIPEESVADLKRFLESETEQ